jgi:hypothetical protein
LACFEAERKVFCQIVTADESWIHHFELQTKRHSVEWHHPLSSQEKKLKKSAYAGKVMITVFWDCEGRFLWI